MENFKTRNFRAVLYPEEDLTHLFALNKLESGGYFYCACEHDQDRYDATNAPSSDQIGQLKKKHTHVVIKLKNPRYRLAFAEELGIESNYLQQCDNYKGAMLYLVHSGYPDKFQYDFDSVYGSLKFDLEKMISNDTESTRVLRILDLLDTMPTPCSYRKFLVAVCENDLYGDFRRMGVGIMHLLEEHNANFV